MLKVRSRVICSINRANWKKFRTKYYEGLYGDAVSFGRRLSTFGRTCYLNRHGQRHYSTMKTKVACFSQKLVSIYPTTRHHIPDDHQFHTATASNLILLKMSVYKMAKTDNGCCNYEYR